MAKAKAKAKTRAGAKQATGPRVPGDIVRSSTGTLFFIPLAGGVPQEMNPAEIPVIARDLGTEPPVLEKMLSKGPGIWALKR